MPWRTGTPDGQTQVQGVLQIEADLICRPGDDDVWSGLGCLCGGKHQPENGSVSAACSRRSVDVSVRALNQIAYRIIAVLPIERGQASANAVRREFEHLPITVAPSDYDGRIE